MAVIHLPPIGLGLQGAWRALVRFSALNYPELPPPIRRGRSWQWGNGTKRGLDQFVNRPSVIRNAERDRWRAAQGLMHAAEIVERDVKRDGS